MTGEEIADGSASTRAGSLISSTRWSPCGSSSEMGDGPEARYRNTAETRGFPGKASPAYIGGILEMSNARLYGFWGDLTEALQTGEPQNEVKQTGKSMFEELYGDPAQPGAVHERDGGISLGNFHALAEKFDFSGTRRCATSAVPRLAVASILAERHPHLQVHELRSTRRRTDRSATIAPPGVRTGSRCGSGDFFASRFPRRM